MITGREGLLACPCSFVFAWDEEESLVTRARWIYRYRVDWWQRCRRSNGNGNRKYLKFLCSAQSAPFIFILAFKAWRLLHTSPSTPCPTLPFPSLLQGNLGCRLPMSELVLFSPTIRSSLSPSMIPSRPPSASTTTLRYCLPFWLLLAHSLQARSSSSSSSSSWSFFSLFATTAITNKPLPPSVRPRLQTSFLEEDIDHHVWYIKTTLLSTLSQSKLEKSNEDDGPCGAPSPIAPFALASFKKTDSSAYSRKDRLSLRIRRD